MKSLVSIPDPFRSENFYYNKEEDYCVCPMGQHMRRIGSSHKISANGYVSDRATYIAQNCKGCPLRCLCFEASGDRRVIERNHKLEAYRQKESKLLTSEEGLRHRGRRSIEPEAVFGQMKYNMANNRFRHFGIDKVNMDFAFFAIAFNIKKMVAKMTKRGIFSYLRAYLPHITPYKLFIRLFFVIYIGSFDTPSLFCHENSIFCGKLCLLLYIPKKWYKIHFFGIKVLIFSLRVYDVTQIRYTTYTPQFHSPQIYIHLEAAGFRWSPATSFVLCLCRSHI